MATTDQDLLSAVQYTLLEPPDGGVSFPSGLWTPAEMLDALSSRQNQFLKDSLMLVGVAFIPALAGQHRFTLPQDWLVTVAVTWFGSDGQVIPLSRSDAFEADHGLPTWVNQTGTPQLYMDQETPTLEVQLAPAPIIAGNLELVYVPEQPALNGLGDILAVPDTYALPVLKYATLAEAFSKDGRGRSPEKAAYCEMRVQLGVEMAQIMLKGWT